MKENMTRASIIRKTAICLLSLILVLPLFGCGGGGMGLPGWADKEQLTQQAREVIELVNAREFDEVAGMFPSGVLTGEQLEASLSDLLDGFGAFKSFGAHRLETVIENGVVYVRVLQVVNYQNQSVTYRVIFEEGGILSGFWL